MLSFNSVLTRSSGNAKGGTMQLWATSPGLSQFDCLARLNVTPSADVGRIQDELTEILAKRYKIDHYEIHTDANFIFIYTLDDLLPDPDTNPPITVTESLPRTTETPTTTIPQRTSTTTEIITTAKTTGTTPNQVTTTEVVSSLTETARITTSTALMETTLAGSSTTIKETTALSSTTSLTLNTTACSSTISPEGNISESYFNVNVSVNIICSDDPENIITTWLHETLSSKGIDVLHLKILTSSTHARKQSVETKSFKLDRKQSLLLVTSHSCVFHAQVKTSSNITETINLIDRLLEKPYSSGAVFLYAQPEDIFISYIEPCPEHNHHTRHGLFKWPQFGVQLIVSLSCVGNPEKTAYRQCFLGANSNNALWKSPDLGQCQVVVNTVSDLEDITVTNGNPFTEFKLDTQASC
ncbi:uncharacterized protein LOC107718781 [Sinocyclocheilus rhinocerous]|uniref:uncharacterized protein LOC107718781 n=1 Tax=Sinocyclocheilus rhinocerous TaxID=307959 RepID=UPI0007B90E06|nr:PREDICTED: uncharacterized protein LOC107718781 [Sinocyclocheilus rhinocerous]